LNGLPRMSSLHTKTLAGVRTNMRLPDVLTVGLGGGSVVRLAEDDGSDATIGPDSIGFRLTSDAVSFGGKCLTLTDVALACSSLSIPEAAHVNKVFDLAPKDQLTRTYR
jgi:N-methylhydantoinase A/oxoprolinase/acetone carboxylase beta subunit